MSGVTEQIVSGANQVPSAKAAPGGDRWRRSFFSVTFHHTGTVPRAIPRSGPCGRRPRALSRGEVGFRRGVRPL